MCGILESFSQYCAIAHKFNFHSISLSGLVSWHMTSIFMDHISFRMLTTSFLLLTGVGITLQSGAHWNYLVSDQLFFLSDPSLIIARPGLVWFPNPFAPESQMGTLSRPGLTKLTNVN